MKNNVIARTSVCIISTVHDTFDNRIFHKECKSLHKAGYEVNLIIQHLHDEIIEGIKIHALSKPSNRFIRITVLAHLAYKKALKIDAEVYHFHDPELLIIGLLLKMKGKKVIYDVHEDLPRQIMYKNWIFKPFRSIISKLMEMFEKGASKGFDHIIVATPFLKDLFIKYNENTIDINNYPYVNELYNNNDSGWHEKNNTVVYIGGLSTNRGIVEMMKAVYAINYRLIIGGKFESDNQLNQLKYSEEWKNVDYRGVLNRQEVKELLSKGIVGLVVLHPLKNYVDAQPTKLYEYMSAGIPVISSDFPSWKKIIEDNNCGICVNPLDIEEISQAILYLGENLEQAKIMGDNGRKAIEEKLNWGCEEIKLLNLYMNLTQLSEQETANKERI